MALVLETDLAMNDVADAGQEEKLLPRVDSLFEEIVALFHGLYGTSQITRNRILVHLKDVLDEAQQKAIDGISFFSNLEKQELIKLLETKAIEIQLVIPEVSQRIYSLIAKIQKTIVAATVITEGGDDPDPA